MESSLPNMAATAMCITQCYSQSHCGLPLNGLARLTSSSSSILYKIQLLLTNESFSSIITRV